MIKVFFGGTGHPLIEMDERLGSPRYRMLSCHPNYVQETWKTSALLSYTDDRWEIMYDSGAYTAWAQGERIDLASLIDAYKKLVDRYAGTVWLINLDIIPALPGRTATHHEIEEALKQSDENFYRLNAEFPGMVLPVYHQSELPTRLDTVMEMAAYIGISPRNDKGEDARVDWAGEEHGFLKDGVRSHGLGATGYDMLKGCCWHSVDSKSWTDLAGAGKIWLDEKLTISHVKYLTTNEVNKWNIQPSHLKNDYLQRELWNRLMMNECVASIAKKNSSA